MNKSLDSILNTNAKVRVIRHFISQREDFIASGREIARAVGITPPAAHTALKELYEQGIIRRDIKGKSHLYRLNHRSRIVKTILIPAFQREEFFTNDIIVFIVDQIKKYKVTGKLCSVILYGSQHTGDATEDSDVDIAVVVGRQQHLPDIESIFISKIEPEFDEYFRAHLDIYIKSKRDFVQHLKKKLPPVASLIKSYSIIYGEDPLDWL